VKSFADSNNGLLPLSGAMPDMKAESRGYIALQNMWVTNSRSLSSCTEHWFHRYRSKARSDAAAVERMVWDHMNRVQHPKRNQIDRDAIQLFCRHANFLRRLNYRSIADEFSDSNEEHKRAVLAALGDWGAEDSLINDYIALRAYQEFYTSHGRAPGDTSHENCEDDYQKIRGIICQYLESVGYTESLPGRCEKVAKEIIRAGGGELHVTASIAGGIVAQEVIKVC